MVKKLLIRRSLVTALVAGCVLNTGCGKVTMDNDIYFWGVEDAKVETFYDITDDGNEYFISRDDLAFAIPGYNESYYVGLRVTNEGNAIAVESDDIQDGDSVIICRKALDGNSSEKSIYMSDVDNVEVISGYTVVIDGETYDLSKQDVIDYMNDTNVSIIGCGNSLGLGSYNSFASNPNGGPDFIKK